MLSIAMSKLRCTELIFILHGAKVIGAYYRDELLAKHMLPTIRQIAGDHFIFQQDSATVHRTRDTVDFLRRSTPQFITPGLWPPNSPDLNPVYYKIWGVMQDRVYKTAIRDLDDLKRRLIAEWSGLQQNIVDDAVDQWRKRLHSALLRGNERLSLQTFAVGLTLQLELV